MTNSRANSQIHTIAVQQADQSIASETSLQNSTELLSKTLTISKSYSFEMLICFKAEATEKIKFDFAVPSGAAILINTTSMGGTTPASTVADGETDVVLAGTGGNQFLHIIGTLILSTTSGVLQFRFCQSVSGAPATIVRAGSTLILYSDVN